MYLINNVTIVFNIQNNIIFKYITTNLIIKG